MDWYSGTIDANSFSESTVNQVFNEYEKVNSAFLSKIEEQMGTYQLDQ